MHCKDQVHALKRWLQHKVIYYILFILYEDRELYKKAATHGNMLALWDSRRTAAEIVLHSG